jgi:hypothetical protein
MVLKQNELETEKDLASNLMPSLFAVVYLDEEPGQFTAVLPHGLLKFTDRRL